MEYIDFLKSKEEKVVNNGFKVSREDLNNNLFEYQKDIVLWALSKGKAALFEDCGLGKGPQMLEWSNIINKKTGEDVLIVTPLGVAIQMVSEAKKVLDLNITLAKSQEDVKAGVNVTNYENLDKFDESKFIAVALDESSILKNYTGKTRMKLKSKFKNIKYKLVATATPAPNDYIELLNQADFLEVMDTAKSLSMFFINDMKTGDWRLKGHSVKAFWEWVSEWAVYIKSPSDLGYSDKEYKLPELEEIKHILKIDTIDRSFKDGFLRKIETSATSFHKEKNLTADLRCKECAKIACSTNEQYLIWVDTNNEADLLKKYIPEAVEVRGSDKSSFKEEASIKFKEGKIRVLISKPKIFGYGMNFQMCHNAVFCGLTYSYEDYYQATRRLYRFGQKNKVNNYIVIGNTENRILEVIREKQDKQKIMELNINNSIRNIQLRKVKGTEKEEKKIEEIIEIPVWLKGDNNAI